MRTSCLCRASWEAPKGAEEGVPPEDLSPDDAAARAEEAARKRLEDEVHRDAALAAAAAEARRAHHDALLAAETAAFVAAEAERDVKEAKVFTAEEKEAKAKFDLFDKDKSGDLEIGEVNEIVRWVAEIQGETLPEERVAFKAQQLVDARGDRTGSLEFDDVFQLIFRNLQKERAANERAERERAHAEKLRAQAEAFAAAQAEKAREAEAEAAALAAQVEAEAEVQAAAKAAAEKLAARDWTKIDIPVSPPVVRKDIRKMSKQEQERYAAAVKRMMESVDGVPGTSQFFRLASLHGGPKTAMWNPVGEYCVHGYEAFPGWHRAYLLDFERTMRQADISLGNDGMLGLPFWGWEEIEVNGEVFPKILRDHFEKYPDDMFPAEVQGKAKQKGDAGLVVRPDASLERMLRGKGAQARKSLDSAQHWQHACTREGGANKPSIEDPHNSIHGGLRGVMASYQSAFHPVFWMHHNNIDRFCACQPVRPRLAPACLL